MKLIWFSLLILTACAGEQTPTVYKNSQVPPGPHIKQTVDSNGNVACYLDDQFMTRVDCPQ